jgi:hypothetical protein
MTDACPLCVTGSRAFQPDHNLDSASHVSSQSSSDQQGKRPSHHHQCDALKCEGLLRYSIHIKNKTKQPEVIANLHPKQGRFPSLPACGSC